jgi:hypothetical protein
MTYTDHIVVLRGHLEELYQALDTATGYHTADDLARQYKNVGSTHRPSNLTKRLEQARDRAEGYLLAQEDDSVPEE